MSHLGIRIFIIEPPSPTDVKSPKNSEKQLYPLAVEAVRHYFERKGVEATFWITSERIPEETLKYLRDEVLFLVDRREFRPDIIGAVKSLPKELEKRLGIVLEGKLITVEVKGEEVGPQDWLQARNYGDIYYAPISLFISPNPLPERLKRLVELSPSLRCRSIASYRICHARLDMREATLTEFFPEEILP
jgi:hypothetical protein